MPLSEREQQILDELEKELHGTRSAGDTERFRGLKIGILVFVAGIVLLVWFFASGLVAVGVASFTAMVTGVFLGASSVRAEVGRSGSASDRIARTFGSWDEALRRRYRRR